MIGANHHTSIDSQEMALTLDLGIEFYGGYNVLRDQGQKSSAQLSSYSEKAEDTIAFPISFSFYSFLR